jgi:glycopeptide antibiotics resistance protein
MTPKEYVILLLKSTPPELYAGLICMLLIGLLVSFWLCGGKRGLKVSALIFFVVYGIFMICITVIYRRQFHQSHINLMPFWSYAAITSGKDELIKQIIMNVLAFVPIGASLALGLKKAVWWKVVLVGCMVSVCVEALQFYYKRGLCEIDDVMHNSIGCLIGYGIFSLVRIGYERFCKRSVESLIKT